MSHGPHVTKSTHGKCFDAKIPTVGPVTPENQDVKLFESIFEPEEIFIKTDDPNIPQQP